AARAVEAGMDVVRQWRPGDEAPDAAAEAAMIAVLERDDAGTAIAGEISGGESGGDRVWVVDPVDGTENLLRGDRFVAVTLALLVDGGPAAGATACPFTRELWTAARGKGAYDRSGRRLTVASGRRRRVV